MLDDTLKGYRSRFTVDEKRLPWDAVISGEILGVATVQHSTQTEFLPFLALPDSLAGKRIAYVVLEDD